MKKLNLSLRKTKKVLLWLKMNWMKRNIKYKFKNMSMSKIIDFTFCKIYKFTSFSIRKKSLYSFYLNNCLFNPHFNVHILSQRGFRGLSWTFPKGAFHKRRLEFVGTLKPCPKFCMKEKQFFSSVLKCLKLKLGRLLWRHRIKNSY